MSNYSAKALFPNTVPFWVPGAHEFGSGPLFNPVQTVSGIFGRSHIMAKKGSGFLKTRAHVNLNAGREA